MISNEDIEYIKYVYEKKDSALKPNVRRIVRCYNEVFKDKMKRPLSENICACNIRPYLIQLYREIETTFISPQDNIIENEKVEDEKKENEVRTVENVKPKKQEKNVKPKIKNKKKNYSGSSD